VPRSPHVWFSNVCEQVESCLVLDKVDWLRRQHLQIPPLVFFFQVSIIFLGLGFSG
jgi:hypothetical protein